MSQCACPRCDCEVNASNAVTVGTQQYCSQACAENHPQDEGCGHSGCVCA